jgi:hypothetical protein
MAALVSDIMINADGHPKERTTAAEDHRYKKASELWRIATGQGILLQRLLLRCVVGCLLVRCSKQMFSCKQS